MCIEDDHVGCDDGVKSSYRAKTSGYIELIPIIHMTCRFSILYAALEYAPQNVPIFGG
jgi:hypothetical protein